MRAGQANGRNALTVITHLTQRSPINLHLILLRDLLLRINWVCVCFWLCFSLWVCYVKFFRQEIQLLKCITLLPSSSACALRWWKGHADLLSHGKVDVCAFSSVYIDSVNLSSTYIMADVSCRWTTKTQELRLDIRLENDITHLCAKENK